MLNQILDAIAENRVSKIFYIFIKWLFIITGTFTVNKLTLPILHIAPITFLLNAFWFALFIRFELISDYKELKEAIIGEKD